MAESSPRMKRSEVDEPFARAVRQRVCAEASESKICLFCLSSGDDEDVCQCGCRCKDVFCCVACLYKTGRYALEMKKTCSAMITCTICKQPFSDRTIQKLVAFLQKVVRERPPGTSKRVKAELLGVDMLLLAKDPMPAQQLLHNLMSQYASVLGKDHESFAALEYRLGVCSLRRDRLDEARTLLVSAEAKQATALEPQLCRLMNTRATLAVVFWKLGFASSGAKQRRYLDGAESMLRNAVGRLRALVGEVHPCFIAHQSNFSQLLALRHRALQTRLQRERFETAINAAEYTLQLQRRVHAAGDDRTRRLALRVADMRARLEETKRGRSL